MQDLRCTSKEDIEKTFITELALKGVLKTLRGTPYTERVLVRKAISSSLSQLNVVINKNIFAG